MIYLKNILTLITLTLIFLASQPGSNAFHDRIQAEPVLLERYFGDQIATTFLALDALSIELMKQPDARGHIIIHNGVKDPPGLPYRHSLGVKNYFVRTKNIPLNRIDVIIGRSCETFSVDVWLVPSGVELPRQKCTFETSLEDTGPSGKFDEYFFDYEHPDGSLYDDPYLRLESFANELLTDRNAVGYIIGYAQRQDRSEGKFVGDEYIERKYEIWDKPGTGERIAEQEKRVLVKRSKVDPLRIKIIDGGYRESQMIELWILPSGALEPKPTPTIQRNGNK
jgi:hypothetical protein